MEFNQIIILIIGGLFLIGVIVAYLLKKDYLKFSNIAVPIMKSLLGVVKAVGGIFPSNETINTVVVAMTAAIDAAGYAENLWLQGEIEKNLRPEYAQEYIEIIMMRAGIEITDSIRTIMDGAIAIACYLMPHHSGQEGA